MKKTRFWAILMTALFTISAVCACGDDDDDEGYSGQSDNVSLLGRTFERTNNGGLETKTIHIEFISKENCMVRVSGFGYDEDGRYTYDWGDILCPYTISGNTVTINVVKSDGYYETYNIRIVNGGLEGYEEKSSGKSTTDASQEGITPGYYFCKEVTQAYSTMSSMAAAQDQTIGSATLEDSPAAIRVIDNVLMQNYYVTAKHSSGGGSIASETFTVKGKRYPLSFYLSDPAGDVFSYTMKGNDVYVGNYKRYTYSNGELIDGTYRYKKVK